MYLYYPLCCISFECIKGTEPILQVNWCLVMSFLVSRSVFKVIIQHVTLHMQTYFNEYAGGGLNQLTGAFWGLWKKGLKVLLPKRSRLVAWQGADVSEPRILFVCVCVWLRVRACVRAVRCVFVWSVCVCV